MGIEDVTSLTLEQMFEAIDVNHNGALTVEELTKHFEKLPPKDMTHNF